MKTRCLPFLVLTLPGCYNFGDEVLAEGPTATGGSVSTGQPNSGAGGTVAGGTSTSSLLNITDLTEAQWNTINDASCAGWSTEVEEVGASIVFIVDTSRSMDDVAPNTTDSRTKWAITRAALQNALDKLPRMTSVGMLLWPNKTTIPNNYTTAYAETGGIEACVAVSSMVPLAKLGAADAEQRSGLAAALNAVIPQGGTPMADAYNYAIDSNYGNQPLLPNARYAVLITDGQPTIQLGCMGTGEEKHPVDYQPVIDSIGGAHAAQPMIRTFVIGSPGSENQSATGDDGRDWLSEAAKQGGTQTSADCDNSGNPNFCHFDMSAAADFASGFSAALQTITGQVMPCSFVISGDVPVGQRIDFSQTNVIYEINGSRAIGQMKLVGPATDSNCAEGHGWYFDPIDATSRTIRLCPMTCEMVRQDVGAVVNVRGGCATIPIIG